MLERRRLPRTRIFASAKLIPGWSLGCACVVRNITSLGALLEFQSVAVLPIMFELTFDSARTLRFCRMAWRTRTKGGVEFCARSVLDDRPLPPRPNVRYRAPAQKNPRQILRKNRILLSVGREFPTSNAAQVVFYAFLCWNFRLQTGPSLTPGVV